jgi:hypothetical protein
MAEPHVIGAFRNKRAELAGTLRELEQQLAGHKANLAHLDATMRLFDPKVRPQDIRPRRMRARNVWFRQGECLRLIYDELREATQPVTTRELAERVMLVKAIPAADDRQRELIGFPCSKVRKATWPGSELSRRQPEPSHHCHSCRRHHRLFRHRFRVP